MFRVHCLQQCYSLSDASIKDSLFETTSIRNFSGLSSDTSLTDHTTIMNYRDLLERHYLGRQIFETINQWLKNAGKLVKKGSSIDATIIEAP